MTVGPPSTKLPQSWDTESDQLGVPAILRIRAGPPVAAKDDTIRTNICNLANGIPRDDRSASVLPDSNSAKALSDSRSAGASLEHLATPDYICLFLEYEP